MLSLHIGRIETMNITDSKESYFKHIDSTQFDSAGTTLNSAKKAKIINLIC